MGTDPPKMPSQNQRADSSFAQVAWKIIISYYLASLQTKTLRRYHPIFFHRFHGDLFQPTIPSSGGSTVVTDLPNSVENLVLQVSCSWLGAAVATAKDWK